MGYSFSSQLPTSCPADAVGGADTSTSDLNDRPYDSNELPEEDIEQPTPLNLDLKQNTEQSTPHTQEDQPEVVKKNVFKLDEIVKEFLGTIDPKHKNRTRMSNPMMMIANELASLEKQVELFVGCCGKQDKSFLKLEEYLTRCLLKFDEIDRTDEVVTRTRKKLINFTQQQLDILESKAIATNPDLNAIHLRQLANEIVYPDDYVAPNETADINQVLKNKKAKNRRSHNYHMRKNQ